MAAAVAAAASQAGTIDAHRLERCPTSARLYERAQRVFPGGVTHDSRHHAPFPLYVTHAEGSRKWDVDGNEYVDYRMGHGALLLGHNHPAVSEAVAAQVSKGSHFGASHELEIAWGERVQRLVPSAERVKFLSSGTEATMMAMRLARAATGKDKVLKMIGGFHGWHDFATAAMQPPYEVPNAAGVPAAVSGTILAAPKGDATAVERLLAERDDVAAVILTCDGATREYLQSLRDSTRRHGVVLIFDEVITGFRWAPGGCQEYFGVTPDMTTLAKILAGGYPGAAIGARADLMERMEFREEDAEWTRYQRIPHPGTFNANPVSSAAGVACLDVVRDNAVQRKAVATADALRTGIRLALARRGVDGSATGESSFVNLALPTARGKAFTHRFRSAMQLGGVDFSGAMIVSAVHDDRDVAQTLDAFDAALGMLQTEGLL
jgi:glutamate-1-semialdehyde 2,1-aminomutase